MKWLLIAERSAFSKSTMNESESKSGQYDLRTSMALEYDEQVLSSIKIYMSGTQVLPT